MEKLQESRRQPGTQSGGLFPKNPAFPGSLHREWVQCGKPACRCARGARHGPYTYRRWYEHGKQHKVYVQRDQLAVVQAAIARWRQLHPPAWSMRQSLAELHQLAKEIQRCQT